MVDEETALVQGGSHIGKHVYKINIERIRFFGLLGGAVLLGTGYFVSTYAVVFPPKDDPSSFWDKVTRKAPSDFDTTQTFIFKMFHFNHTCTFLDFNPSKTIAALIIQLHTLPLMFFVVCHYLRIQAQTNPVYDNLKIVTKIFSPISFITLAYFYMVFVNSPNGEFGTDDGMLKFTLHWIPYMCWQLGMLLMAVQQCWFIACKGDFPLPWITPKLMFAYVQFMLVMFIIYGSFVWSFIFNKPLWDTHAGTPGAVAAKLIMFVWDLIAAIVPTIFAFIESRDGNDTVFTFHELGTH